MLDLGEDKMNDADSSYIRDCFEEDKMQRLGVYDEYDAEEMEEWMNEDIDYAAYGIGSP